MLEQIKNEMEALSPLVLEETDYFARGYHLNIELSSDRIAAAAELLDKAGFFLEAITGVDWLAKFENDKKAAAAAAAKKAKEAAAAAAKVAEEAGEEPPVETAPAEPEPQSEPEPEEEPEVPLEVVYDFNNFKQLCRVTLRCKTPRNTPEVPSITDIIPGANWHERETHDFFGIVFSGHPDLSPLLLPEDADFHPLLKDFKP